MAIFSSNTVIVLVRSWRTSQTKAIHSFKSFSLCGATSFPQCPQLFLSKTFLISAWGVGSLEVASLPGKLVLTRNLSSSGTSSNQWLLLVVCMQQWLHPRETTLTWQRNLMRAAIGSRRSTHKCSTSMVAIPADAVAHSEHDQTAEVVVVYCSQEETFSSLFQTVLPTLARGRG